MAVLFSIDDNVQLTGKQHRGIIRSSMPDIDFVVDDYGLELACSYSGWNVTINTGMAVVGGPIVENTEALVRTFPIPSGSGLAMVIARVNLVTKSADIVLKTGTALQQDDPLNNNNAIREYELYRFNYSPSSITNFTDKRKIISVKAILDKLAVNIPIGSLIQQGVTNFFKPTSDQALVAGQTPTIALVKEVGDLIIASNLITLPKGYFYAIHFGFGAYGVGYTGSCQAKIVKSDGTAIGNGCNSKGRSVIGAWGEHTNPQGWHYIDLTAASADIQIKFFMEAIEVDCAIDRFCTHLSIEKYKKAI